MHLYFILQLGSQYVNYNFKHIISYFFGGKTRKKALNSKRPARPSGE